MKRINSFKPAQAAIYIIAFGIILSALYPGCKEDNIVVPPADHYDAEGMMILNESLTDTVYYVFRGVAKPGMDTLKAPLGSLTPHWKVYFLDDNAQRLNPPTDPDKSFGWDITNPAVVEVFQDPGDRWDFHLRGLSLGQTTMRFKILHAGHADFTTPFIPVIVDTSISGDATGIKIIDEDSGELLYRDSSGVITGSLSVAFGDTSDHMVVYFLDKGGNTFQPPSPPHSLGFEVADENILGIDPPGADEPYAFRLIGRNLGNTTMVIQIKVGAEIEFNSNPVQVLVSPL
jgi:hypothetical protein